MNTECVIGAGCAATEVEAVRHTQPVTESVSESDIQRRVRLELVGNCGLCLLIAAALIISISQPIYTAMFHAEL